jgi:hypothetical protein
MNQPSNSTRQKIIHLATWILILFGSVVCIGVAALFGGELNQPLWPFPGLYFVELVGLAVLGAGSQVASSTVGSTKTIQWLSSPAIPWIITGVLLPFVILGGFSIGPFLLPALLAFFVAGILTDWYTRSAITSHMSVMVISTVIQGAFIVIMNLLSLPQY